MIKLKLIRETPDNIEQKFTHGELFIKSNGDKWLDFCYTLEDQVRDINKSGDFDGEEKKVYGETAIPFGFYHGQVTFSNRFKREMPAIFDVPGFEGIRMHGGNTNKDTLGCPLVAHNTDNKGKIWGSAESELTKLIKENDINGKYTIEII